MRLGKKTKAKTPTGSRFEADLRRHNRNVTVFLVLAALLLGGWLWYDDTFLETFRREFDDSAPLEVVVLSGPDEDAVITPQEPEVDVAPQPEPAPASPIPTPDPVGAAVRPEIPRQRAESAPVLMRENAAFNAASAGGTTAHASVGNPAPPVFLPPAPPAAPAAIPASRPQPVIPVRAPAQATNASAKKSAEGAKGKKKNPPEIVQVAPAPIPKKPKRVRVRDSSDQFREVTAQPVR